MADPVDVFQLDVQGPGTVLSGGGRRLDIIQEVDPNVQTGTTVVYYRMRGRDANSVGLVYRYWTVESSPDVDGSGYLGSYDGGSLNLVDIAVVETFNHQPVAG